MKTTLRLFAVLILACASAFAWPSCSGSWVQVPAGTSSVNGAIYTTGDNLTFQCQKPSTDPKGTAITNTLASSSNSTATGGNATAVAQGGQGGSAKQDQTQKQSSVNTNEATAKDNGNNSNNSVTNIAASKIPVASAYAPGSLPSAPCVKGFGAGIQTMPIGGSLGGSKTDADCNDRETARSYALLGSRLAACKTLVFGTKNQKLAKKHPEQAVTLDDCMQQDETQQQQTAVVAPVAPPVAPIMIAVQTPPAQVVVLHEEVTVTATREQVRAADAAAKKPAVKRTIHKPCTCTIPDSLKKPIEK